MRSLSVFLATSFLSAFAMAYTDGTYQCSEHYTFKIKTVQLAQGVSAPYMETTVTMGAGETFMTKGIALVLKDASGTEEITHNPSGSVRIQFVQNKTSCAKVN